VAAAVGTTTAVAEETILNFLITGVIFEEIVLLDSGATIGTLLTIAILIRPVQSIAIFHTLCTFTSSNSANLENFLLVPLFLLSILAFLSLTSFLREEFLVLDLWGWVVLLDSFTIFLAVGVK